MNPVDNLIGFFAPSTALKRQRARAALDVVQKVRSQYAGAGRSRQGQHKNYRHTPPLGASIVDVARVRAASRDLVRNDPTARRGIDAVVSNTIGRGILPRVVGPDGDQDEVYKPYLEDHLMTTAIDAAGQQNLTGLQMLVMRAVVEGGEAIIRRRMRRAGDGLPLPFQLEVLESEFIDSSVDGPLPNGNFAVKGIELDPIGRRVAYHLFAEHPNDLSGLSHGFRPFARVVRVDARNICHVYRVDRPGQQRGVPWLAPVIVRLSENSEFIDAQLLRQKMAAQFMAFVRTEQRMDEFMDSEQLSDQDGQTVQFLEAGTIQRLGAGEDVEFPELPRADGSDSFTKDVKRDVASVLGISYEAVSGDYSMVNFSSGRMGWIETGRSVDNWQSNMLRPMMFNPVSQWFFEATLPFVGERRAKMLWVPPAREMLDPVKETNGEVAQIKAGLNSRRNVLARRGIDVLQVDKERAEDQQREQELGIVTPEQAGQDGQEDEE